MSITSALPEEAGKEYPLLRIALDKMTDEVHLE